MVQNTKKLKTILHAFLIWARQSCSACRAVHFWPKSSLREHPGGQLERDMDFDENVSWAWGHNFLMPFAGIMELFEKAVSKALST
jgi:hypothetical protein